MGKKKKKSKLMNSMERVLDNPVAKRLYIALVPLDHTIRDLRIDIEDGDLPEDDPHYARIVKLRTDMVDLLEDLMQSK